MAMVVLLAAMSMAHIDPTSKLLRVPIHLDASPGKISTGVSEPIESGFAWDEVIPSWNVENSGNCKLKVLIQGIAEGRETDWYQIADWYGDMAVGDRSSSAPKSDSDVELLTDVFRARSPLRASIVG